MKNSKNTINTPITNQDPTITMFVQTSTPSSQEKTEPEKELPPKKKNIPTDEVYFRRYERRK